MVVGKFEVLSFLMVLIIEEVLVMVFFLIFWESFIWMRFWRDGFFFRFSFKGFGLLSRFGGIRDMFVLLFYSWLERVKFKFKKKNKWYDKRFYV